MAVQKSSIDDEAQNVVHARSPSTMEVGSMLHNSGRSSHIMAAALVVAGTLALAACSSSGGGSTTNGGTASASSAGPVSTASASSAGPVSSASAPASSPSGSASAVAKVPFTGPAPTPLAADQIAAAKATLADHSVLTVCTSLPSQPFESQDASGKVTGFDMDFMTQMAGDLGVSMSVVDVPFTAISSGQGMLSKRCDIAAAGMTILASRRATIEFSNPYFDTEQALVALSSSGVSTLSDLKGKRLAAQNGTTGLILANQYQKQYGYTVVQYAGIGDEEQAIQSNQVAAALNDLPAWTSYVKQQNGKVRVAQSFNTGAQMGFGAAKGNTALIAVANYVLAKAQGDGDYTKSYEKWIGPAPAGS
jgi:polar amino acid transport system substrate-binding protein